MTLSDRRLRAARRKATRQIRRARELPEWFPERFEDEHGDRALALADALRSSADVDGADPRAITQAARDLSAYLDSRVPLIYRSSFLETLEAFALAVVLFFLLRTFVFGAYKIPSGSMRPGLVPGDRVVALKVPYGFTVPLTTRKLGGFAEPARGEVVVLRSPENPWTNLVKRVIALPGDTVEIKDGRPIVNGEVLPCASLAPEDGVVRCEERAGDAAYVVFYDAAGPGALRDVPPRTVPAGYYLVLGDNRDHSRDGRAFGLVSERRILARAAFIYLSVGKDGSWARIGRAVR